ncbi:sensor histidine kinase [Chitinophaga sp. GCM10012297]|uniref:Histidine kinase n=1 Tax=Chitinophaga chungangae TaxID=2821488 RepID=A0ABS3YK92_9BACT|nr:histidine kinase [Chitinophaga chungangae]MBO9154855.1 histidine kinase [Chitinophaga chungangae]
MKIRYRYWACQLGGWSFFTYLWHNIRAGEGFAWRLDVFGDKDFYSAFLIGIFSTHLLYLYLRKQQVERYRLGAVFLKVWGAVSLTALLIQLLITGLTIIEEGGWSSFFSSIYKSMDENQFHGVAANIVLGGIFLAMWCIWHLVVWGWVIVYFSLLQGRFRRIELENANRLKQAELDNLKTKLNPHFLFNALSSIRSLIAENPERAQQAVGELAEVLRSAMLSEHQQLIPFGKELEVVQHYLAIEKIRFEERLRVHYTIDPQIHQQTMPPMLLQTLVENAIKHGISKLSAGGDISISAALEDRMLVLRVENTGQVAETVTQTGFGIQGTIKRLTLLYGNKANFTIHNTARQTVCATVKFPAA